MSHVTLQESVYTDIDALETAACRPEIGLELIRNQATFHNWATDHNGQLVGDYSDLQRPPGLTDYTEIMKRCRHAIRIPAKTRTGSYSNYEIGVIESAEKQGEYHLAYDFWGGALDRFASTKPGQLDKLKMFYELEVARKEALSRGYGVVEQKSVDGAINLRVNTDGKMQSVTMGR